ncbi:hypothetical protein PRZ48_010150 [Zasmidium cellare]|uniref:Cystathionine gamma-synthase n=1 Tax=Zasmidium cellare TaxID=395010 RepID=A0ABR0EDT2_ZASCE|nr:hypothetical protein PRZ48_010150 [Zasmidium cellare]
MAALWAAHRCTSQVRSGIDAIVGFPFKSTHHLLQNLGDGVRLFDSAASLESAIWNAEDNFRVIWTEVPSNPLLTTADLIKLRTIADKHKITLIIDDTIGSFCNIDILGVADILITSLTKSFSGYADVMGGSLVLNPASPRYQELKSTINDIHANDYWSGDAEMLEKNSRDYLSRSSILNTNAERLVSYLKRYAEDERSTVAKLYYPTINADRKQYDRVLRPRSEGFTPGYGCLFTIEFESLAATRAFYDNLSVYNGPHLGAHLTLAMAYVKGLYSQQLDWVAQYGLKETHIRISVGLEDFETLRDRFDVAVAAADIEKDKNP